MTDEKALREKLELARFGLVGEYAPTMAEMQDGDWVRYEDIVPLLREKEELVRLGQAVVSNRPCSDPDCCDRAIKNAVATDALRAYLNGCGHPVQVKQPQDAATKEEG